MIIPQTNPRNRWSQLVWFGSWVVITTIASILSADPHGHGTHQKLGLPPCPSVLLFDRPCPGCGLTTSWTALLHGDFTSAFRAHALGPILYAGFTASALLALWMAVKSVRLDPRDRRIERGLSGVALVFFAFGLIRMAVTPNYRTEHERALVQIIQMRK